MTEFCKKARNFTPLKRPKCLVSRKILLKKQYISRENGYAMIKRELPVPPGKGAVLIQAPNDFTGKSGTRVQTTENFKISVTDVRWKMLFKQVLRVTVSSGICCCPFLKVPGRSGHVRKTTSMERRQRRNRKAYQCVSTRLCTMHT